MIIRTRPLLRVAATALIASAISAVSFGAYAAPDAPAPAAAMAASAPVAEHGPHGHRWAPGGPGGRGSRGGREGFGGRGFEHMLDHLHDQLKLNAQQEQAWQHARDTSKHDFQGMRANFEEARKQFAAAGQQPILDLAAIQAARQQIESRNQALRLDAENTWISFYNTLNDAQKTIVSNDIKRHWKHHGKHGWMHHRMDGRGWHGGPPPADAPQGTPAGQAAAPAHSG